MDEYRFNRASLLNAGFQETKAFGCDYIALHDVDLIPVNQKLSYAYPVDGPYHLAAPGLHPKYDYSTFIGGIPLDNENKCSNFSRKNKFQHQEISHM